jgi:integrase
MIYLGKHGTPASQEAYGRAVAELAASSSNATTARPITINDLTVVELCSSYLDFAAGYYRKNGRPSDWLCHIRLMITRLCHLHGREPAATFGPLKFKAVRQSLVDAGHSRPYINKLMAIVPRVFKWGAAEELVPAAVYHSLRTVEGLKKGRTKAPEPDPVLPVEDMLVEATLPHLPPIVADMVRFQRLTTARPGEVCSIRPCDVDRSGDVWGYRPEHHKNEHHKRQRVVFIGPRAQDVLRPYLLRDSDAFCFSPAESESARKAERRSARKTKVQPSQANRAKAHPKRKPKDHYTKDSYNRAIGRAIQKANAKAKKDAEQQGIKPPALIPHWHANQLRHTGATEIRRCFGLEAAQSVLGHAKADVTQVYAERDQSLAAEIMRKIG